MEKPEKKPRNKFPTKETTTSKTETVKIRCTPEFKRVLSKLSIAHKKDEQKYWSESDILHKSLATYILKDSPYYHSFSQKDQNAIINSFMP